MDKPKWRKKRNRTRTAQTSIHVAMDNIITSRHVRWRNHIRPNGPSVVTIVCTHSPKYADTHTHCERIMGSKTHVYSSISQIKGITFDWIEKTSRSGSESPRSNKIWKNRFSFISIHLLVCLFWSVVALVASVLVCRSHCRWILLFSRSFPPFTLTWKKTPAIVRPIQFM